MSNEPTYDPGDIRTLAEAACFIFNDYRELARRHAEEKLFASAAHDMRIARAAANILATRHSGTALGLRYAVCAEECEAAARVYLAQPPRPKGWDAVDTASE